MTPKKKAPVKCRKTHVDQLVRRVRRKLPHPYRLTIVFHPKDPTWKDGEKCVVILSEGIMRDDYRSFPISEGPTTLESLVTDALNYAIELHKNRPTREEEIKVAAKDREKKRNRGLRVAAEYPRGPATEPVQAEQAE